MGDPIPVSSIAPTSKVEPSSDVTGGAGDEDGEIDMTDSADDEPGVNDVTDVVTVSSKGAESRLGSDLTGESGHAGLAESVASVMVAVSAKKKTRVETRQKSVWKDL